ncbi:MAG: hypothetical protein RL417_2329 [Pseudomonadota bacterium]|jgi:hypothetical protein
MVDTSNKRADSLTGREERLLSKLHDGECGFVERFRAERIRDRSAPAREFLALLNNTKKLAEERASRIEKGDLWSGIMTRIAQEERAEIFLGRRRTTAVERFFGFLREHRHVAWGIPSGAALAGLIVLFVAPTPGSQNETPFGVANGSGVRAPVVNLASSSGARVRQPVEVDWVRGNGRVRVMQDPHRNSAIIWVRRPQASKLLPGERFVAPTPLGGIPLQSTIGGYPR